MAAQKVAMAKAVQSEVMAVQGGKLHNLDYADDLNEPFLCFICLELVHKPVVNACGHMFCFRCIHQAMSERSESYCPLCRRPYMHFPRVCEQFHFLLLKALPDAYRRRCREAYEVELGNNWFSPQFNDGLDFNLNGEDNKSAAAESTLIGTSSASSASSASSELRLPRNVQEDKANSKEVQFVKGKLLETSSSSSSVEADSDVISRQAEGTPSSSPYVTTSDLLCTCCNKLLYRPVVINCGHVFCEGCIKAIDDGESPLMCSTCGSAHPGAFPQVCLELHQYLEQNFSTVYEGRKIDLATHSLELQKCRSIVTKLQPSDTSKFVKRVPPRPHPRVHPSTGCDGCGMCPMLGRRFKCTDCPHEPGYDLCFSCYAHGTNLAGRFNQKHSRQHRMREVVGNSPPFDLDLEDEGEATERMETYFGIVGYFA